MRKTLIIVIFLLVILTLFLSGCQTTNDENDAPNSPPEFPGENTQNKNSENNEKVIEPPKFPE